MGRTHNAIKNIIYNVGNQILTLILAFIARTVFIRVLGMEYLGINGLFADVLGLLSMADLGFGVAMSYSFYKPLANHDEDRIAALVNFYKRAYRIIAVFVGIIGICLIPFLTFLVNLETNINGIIGYYVLSVANVVASYLMVYKTSILSADQKNYEVVKIQLSINIARTLSQILLVIVFKDYTLYLVASLVSTLLGNVLASNKASKIYPFINASKEELDKNERQSILNSISCVFIYKIANISLNATDNIIISILFGTIYVGYYSNYLLIQNRLVIFYTLLFSSVTAGIGNVLVTEKQEKRLDIFECEQSISSIISMIMVPCYVSLVNGFIAVWLGDNYIFDLLTLISIGFNLFFSCTLQPLWTFREAGGLYEKIKFNMVACAIVNIALSVLLGKLIGIAGVIFSTSISRIVTYLWYEPFLLFSTFFGVKPNKYYFGLIKDLLIVSILSTICVLFTSLINYSSFLSWVGTAALVFSFCSIISYCLNKNGKGISLMINYFAKYFSKTKFS